MNVRSASIAQLEALNRCRLPEMVELITFLRDNYTAILESMAKVDDPKDVYRLQGKATALSELVRAIDDAPKQLAKT